MRQLCFSFLPDGPEKEGNASPGVPPRPRRYSKAAPVSPRVAETLRADQDVRVRLRSCGPDALTPVEALTVLLGERSLVPAARLLAAFGSLTALVRATPAELARWVSEEQAERTVLHRQEDDGALRATTYRFCAPREGLEPTGAFAFVPA